MELYHGRMIVAVCQKVGLEAMPGPSKPTPSYHRSRRFGALLMPRWPKFLPGISKRFEHYIQGYRINTYQVSGRQI